MTESATPDPSDPSDADALRQHSQDPAEGPTESDETEPAVPREHSEDPAEG